MKYCCLLLIAGCFSQLQSQSIPEQIQTIKANFLEVDEELVPASSKIRLIKSLGHPQYFLVEDAIHGFQFDCIDIGHTEEVELFFYQQHVKEKWRLVKVLHRTWFAEGHDYWETETAYYFKEQQLFFSYQFTNSAVFDTDLQEIGTATDRREDRFYYADGKLIRRLSKNGKIPAGSKTLDHLPSTHLDLEDHQHYDRGKEWISQLLLNWMPGAAPMLW